MAVSKRLRFEILRRDNHTCRYCGRSAPEVKLTIDHVMPESLGGTNDPGNLVTACADCNGGKSSASPDATVVADVSQTAVAWAAAIRQAADENRLHDNTAVYEAVVNAWTSFRRSQIPGDYRETIDQFLAAGLPADDIVQMAHVADAKPSIYDRWAYFCGCCWTRIRKLQERATEIVGGPIGKSDLPDAPTPVSEVWTYSELFEFVRAALRELGLNAGDVRCSTHGTDCLDMVCLSLDLAARLGYHQARSEVTELLEELRTTGKVTVPDGA